MDVFCLALAVLGFEVPGSVNRIDEEQGPDRTEEARVVGRNADGLLHTTRQACIPGTF